MNDIIDQLNAWLDEPVYDQGLALYQQYVLPGPDGSDFLLRMLQGGADEYNRKKLLAAIEHRRDQLLIEQEAEQKRYPPELSRQLEEAKVLMDERTILKERLRMRYQQGILEGSDMHEWSFRILSITRQLDTIYGRRDFFRQHGYLPDLATLDVAETPHQLMQRQLTLRTYVSRYQKRMSQAVAESEVASCLAKLTQYQKELGLVEAQLKTRSTDAL